MRDLWIMEYEFGSDKNEIWLDHMYLPVIRCWSCGETWGLQARLPIIPPDSFVKILKRTPSPLPVEDFLKLRMKFVELTNCSLNASLIQPGIMVGDAKIVRFKKRNPTGYYLFCSIILVESFLANWLHPFDGIGLHLIPCRPLFHDIFEIVPRISSGYGEIFPTPICEVCGRRDEADLNATAIKVDLHELDTIPEGILVFPFYSIVTEGIKIILEKLGSPCLKFRPESSERIIEGIWSKIQARFRFPNSGYEGSD